MKKSFVFAAIALASLAASATESIHNNATAGALAASASRATAGASAVNQVGIATTATIGIRTGDTVAAGGLGGTGLGGNAAGGNATGGNIGDGAGSANIQVRQAAATAYAPTPSGPRASCRLFAGVGGTTTSGALSGGLPIGNDQTCVSGAMVEFMDTVNRVKAGTFEIDDYLEAACMVESMAKTKGCKAYAATKPVDAPLTLNTAAYPN